MKKLAPELRQQYRKALQDYVTAPAEAGLMRAYELGRAACHEENGVGDLAVAHALALADVLVRDPADTERESLLARAAEFLRETMSPVEMMLRGYQHANRALQDLNATLEQRVEERTAALTASEQRFTRFMQNFCGMAWIKDLQGRYTYVNETAAKVFRRPESEVLGKKDGEMLEFEFADQFVANDRCALESQNGILTTETFRHEDGMIHHSIVSKFPITNAKGETEFVGGMAIDITDRIRAEAALRESEERFRVLADTAPVMIWQSGPDKLRTYFNKPWLAFTGRSLEQELGEGWTEGIHPEDRQRCLSTYYGAIDRREAFRQEYRLRHNDGTYRWVLASGTPRGYASGEFAGYIGSVIDITEQKEMEASLRESGQRLQELADAMPHIVWTAKPDGAFNYFNQRWRQYTGVDCATCTLDSWKEYLHAEDVGPFYERWLDSVKKGEPYQVECRLRDQATGEYRWHLCRGVAMRDSSGRILHWYGTCTDIDQQKKTEETLMLADRRKDEFLAVLSHELRNPLGPIRNALHLFRLCKLDDPELVEARDVIDRQVQQLAGIVDDLLDVFRIVHQKMQLQKEPLDLALLVRQTAEDYRSFVESARLRLEVQVPKHPVWVLADRRRLCQVVTNLLQNATKYSNPGGRMRVEVTQDVAHQQARVLVGDTGIGIAPDFLPHVFDTFAQSNQAIDRPRGGLGLGLALVKGIVLLHGGEVKAASEGLGKGTEISFTLPLTQKPKLQAKPETPAPASSRPLRILIIEDNADAARTLGRLLSRYGHNVKTAETGPLGIRTANSWQPQVVLCDIGLPEMDGFEVAQALRDDPKTASIPLIAISGYGQEDDRRNSREAGFDLHLTKPVDPFELQRLLSVLKVGP